MSATVRATNVAASYGDRSLFSGLDVVVAPGDVIGLVGPNGSGKSTLLRILAGELAPDTGSVTLSPADARLGYLTQEPDPHTDESVRDYLARHTGVQAAQNEFDTQVAALTSAADDFGTEGDAAEHYSEVLDSWLALGGADFDERLAEILDRIGLDIDPDHPMSAASGGQAARIGLAALLLSRLDVYLLDEPTNNLDRAGLQLLEEFVSGLAAPVVVVSHDREFLARTVTKVIEIDLSLQRITTYGGGYEAYLDERSRARRQARLDYQEYAKRRSELAARARRQRAWMSKGVKNARAKAPDNDKIGAKFRAATSEKQAAKATQTERLMERLDEVEEPRREWHLEFSVSAAPRSGAVVAVAHAGRGSRKPRRGRRYWGGRSGAGSFRR
jgi:ATPase subunit of ABC transporter with duplicated ATPase domains